MKINIMKRQSTIMVILVATVLLAIILGVDITVVSADTHYDLDESVGYFDIKVNDNVEVTNGVKTAYMYFCPKKDGAITIKFKHYNQSIFKVTLTKDESGVDYLILLENGVLADTYNITADDSVTYGVKKGVKYAFAIDNESGVNSFGVNTKFKPSKSGASSKSKASFLKRGKKQYALLPIGQKNSQWFMIKVPKKKTITVTFNGYGNGQWKEKIYYQLQTKGKKAITRNVTGNNWSNGPKDKEDELDCAPKQIKLKNFKKGTIIYLRVFTKNKKVSGYYTWSWK